MPRGWTVMVSASGVRSALFLIRVKDLPCFYHCTFTTIRAFQVFEERNGWAYRYPAMIALNADDFRHDMRSIFIYANNILKLFHL